MILVTGATGTVGQEVVRQLQAARASFKAMVRTPAEAEGLRARGITPVLGDYARPETLERALEGVESVFLLTPVALELATYEKNVVEAAKRRGVKHVVKHSVFGADENPPISIVRLHSQSEQHLRQSGLRFTFVRPNSFFQNLTRFHASTIAAKNAFFDSIGDGAVSLIDARDIAAVEVAALMAPEAHENQVHEITGPRAVTNAEIASLLSGALGRPIHYQAIDDAAMHGGVVGAGMPEWMADFLVALYRFNREGRAARVTTTVARILGRAPLDLSAFVAESRPAFAGSAAAAESEAARVERNKKFVRDHFEDFVNRKKADVILKNMTPDFVDHDGPGGKPTDREGDRRMMSELHAAIPDLHVTIEDMVAEGDRVVCRNVWRGTDTARGKRIEFRGIVIWRLEGGKITERWASVEPPRVTA